MACSLDLRPLVPTAKTGAQVTIKLVAATSLLQQASLNGVDLTVNQTNKSVSFTLSAGINTVVLVLSPPPASEPIDVVEDCGGGSTQSIISFTSGIHFFVKFNINAN